MIAVLAAGSGVAGAGLLTGSVVATRRLWFDGFVSEAGIGAQAGPYRLAIWLAALALVLLGGLLAGETVVGAGLLLVAGLAAALSSAVPCSAGCPLPPYESPTLSDLVHAGTSMLSVGAIALATVAVAYLGADPGLRRLSRLAAFVVIPLVAGVGVGLLAIGKGHVTGGFERATLVAVTAWTVAMCVQLARRRPA